LFILGTWWHLTASCRPLPESTTICWDHAHVVSLLLLGHIHTVASSSSLLLLHLHTSPFVLVAYCLFPSNATTGSNDQIHCRHPDYVRSTSARNSYPTCFRRLPSGTPSPVYAAKPIISYFYSGVFP